MDEPQRKIGYVPFYRRRSFWTIAALLAATAVSYLFVAGRIAQRRLKLRISRYVCYGQPVLLEQVAGFFRAGIANGSGSADFAEQFSARGTYLSKARYADQSRGLPFLDRACRYTPDWEEERFRKAEAFIADNSGWLSTLSRFARAGKCIFVNYRQVHRHADIRLPHTNSISHGVNCLCLKAAVHLHRGEAGAAVEALREAKAVNAHLLHEPFLFNAVSALVGERTVLKVAKQVAAAEHLSPVDRELLRRVCLPFDKRRLQESIIVERLAGLDFYYARWQKSAADDPHSFAYLRMLPLAAACGKIEQYLDFVDGCVAVFELPPHRRVCVAEQLAARQCECLHAGNPLLSLAPPICLLTKTYAGYCDDAREIRETLAARDGGGSE